MVTHLRWWLIYKKVLHITDMKAEYVRVGHNIIQDSLTSMDVILR